MNDTAKHTFHLKVLNAGHNSACMAKVSSGMIVNATRAIYIWVARRQKPFVPSPVLKYGSKLWQANVYKVGPCQNDAHVNSESGMKSGLQGYSDSLVNAN